MKKITYIIAVFFLLVSCKTAHNEKHSHHHHFDYDHQSEWQFESGKMQSPINIVSEKVQRSKTSKGLGLHYSEIAAEVENNGHSIEAKISGKATINGREFDLKQVHFHAESEHTINGKHFPIEAHFVHLAENGRIAVVAVFFKEGNKNLGFGEILESINNRDCEVHTNTILPENKSYYHYLGSLTTPPLTENVEWYVLKNPIEVSAQQIQLFKKYYPHNCRNIQPLNNRKVLEYTE